MKNPGAVQMKLKALSVAQGAQVAHDFGRGDCSAGTVVGVFDAEQARSRVVVVGLAKCSLYPVRAEHPPLPLHEAGHETGHGRQAARLIVKNMALGFEDDLLASLRVSQQGAEIAHRAAWHEEGSFLADDRG